MMNCREFKERLGNMELLKGRLDERAQEHLATCSRCRQLYQADLHLETELRRNLKKKPTPERLLERLEIDFAPAEKTATPGRFDIRGLFRTPGRILALPAALAALLLLLLNPLNMGANPLDEFGRLAAQDHMKNLAVAFTVSEVEDIPGWFEKRLGYTIDPPDLSKEGFRLSGGRQCRLGACDAAYLIYEKEGKRASLFIVPATALDHRMKKGDTYRTSVGECEVRFWQESKKLLALVI